MEKLFRYSAFTTDPAGGNPAGIWIGESFPDDEKMQAIAKEVGYSETAFITPSSGSQRRVRYFSPEKEVTFCGHATIASGVVLAELGESGPFDFKTPAGTVTVTTRRRAGRFEAALRSVEPETREASPELIDEVLLPLNWDRHVLDPSIPPVIGYAGAWHLILAVKRPEILDSLSYNFEAVRTIMERENLTTLQLMYRESETLVHSRNPFPVGGVVEDPATGAAAAALGGYLREAELVTPPCSFTVRQGVAMGRPSTLTVDVPVSGGIVVSGTAVEIRDRGIEV